jgi:23S rRNA pseudouridine2605 synthase
MNDEQGRKCVADLVESVGERVYPVGRLDRDSEGLLLFTNDGEFANAMMHPSTHIPKQYRVTLRGEISDEQLQTFADGIELDGKKTLPAGITVVTESPERTVVTVEIHEGRNRQIRRMFEYLGIEVLRLKRTHIGGLKLGVLPVGQWRHLTGKEVLLLARGCTEKKLKAAEKYGRMSSQIKAVKRR